jgi:hypothetical protein
MSDHSCADAAALLAVSRSFLSAEAAARRVPHLRYGAPGSRKPRYVFTDEHLAQIRRAREVPVAAAGNLPKTARRRASG